MSIFAIHKKELIKIQQFRTFWHPSGAGIFG